MVALSLYKSSSFLEDLLDRFCKTHIPRRCIDTWKYSHAWMDEDCHSAIRRKNAAEDTPGYEDANAACARTLSQAYQRHIEK